MNAAKCNEQDYIQFLIATPRTYSCTEVVQPLVELIMSADEQSLTIGPVFDHPFEQHRHSFAGLVCEACGEMVVEGYAHLAGEQWVCIPCHERITGIRESRSAA